MKSLKNVQVHLKPRKKVTPEHKQHRRKWLADLRSGDYQQTTGCMKRNAVEDHRLLDPRSQIGLCCLGVAAISAGIVADHQKWKDFFDFTQYGESRASNNPPSLWFADYFGLNLNFATVMMDTLMACNDIEEPHFTFQHIATIAERLFAVHDQLYAGLAITHN